MKNLVYKTALGSSSIDPWETQFAFFWYNDEEIFHDSEKDLEIKAERFAESGVNHVITFSCTHFRWSFHAYWDLLNETLTKVVDACHKHGMLVTEHHSSELSHYIGSDEDLAYLKDILRVRQSRVESWPEIIASAKGDPVLIDDIKRSEMIQIDGFAGEFRPNGYHGYSMCFNNPHYRRAYFKYLESVYATGVDGIMTDDVQWIGGNPYGNACSCQYCRQRFAESTDFELPGKGDAWLRFVENPKSPAYLAWLDFRFRTVEEFHIAVKEHYEGLGFRLLRPNYCSSVLNSNPSAYALDTLPELDWVFQESCYSTIIRYSWPRWAVEEGHRYALGRMRDIPPMVMFYPDRPDTTFFCWALAMSWGAKYLGTDEGKNADETEKMLRQFEERHQRLLQNPKKISKLAFYDAKRNRELYQNYDTSTGVWTTSWAQACLLNNVSFDFLLTNERERIENYDLIILPDIAVLSDDEIEVFRQFVVNGGTIIWGGKSGSLNSEGMDRSDHELALLLGVTEIPKECENQSISLGKGTIVFLPDGLEKTTPLNGVNLMRFDADAKEKRVPYDSFSVAHQKQFNDLARYIESMIPGGSRLRAPDLPEGVLVSLFVSHDESSLVIHVLNVSETLEVPIPEGVNHEDRIPYPEFSTQVIDLEVELPGRWSNCQLINASAYQPDRSDFVTLTVVKDDGGQKAIVKFDIEDLREYTLIELNFV